MNAVIRINGESVSAEQLVKYLRFTGEFQEVADRFIRCRVTALAARQRGLEVSSGEIQQAADDFRRCMGLHRERDTRLWMADTGITEDEYESFVTDHIYMKKMVDTLVSEESVETWFRLNSPKFDTADIRHIVVDDEHKAMEITALVKENPDVFEEFAREYSLDSQTRDSGGNISGVRRNTLPADVDAMVFSATAGAVLGPFNLDGGMYEIIHVVGINKASLDAYTKENIAKAIYDEWFEEQVKQIAVAG